MTLEQAGSFFCHFSSKRQQRWRRLNVSLKEKFKCFPRKQPSGSLCCWTCTVTLASVLFTWKGASLSQHRVLGIVKMLLTMLGQVPKNSSTPLLRRALFLTPLTFAVCFPCMKITPGDCWFQLSRQSQQARRLIRMRFGIQQISTPSTPKLWLSSLCLCMIMLHCCVVFFGFFAFLFVSTMTACLITTWEGVKKATSQISPLKWYVLAGEIYFSGVLLCCNQREWLSDCDSHHQRLMANQTGGLPTLRGFLEPSCTLSFSLFFIYSRDPSVSLTWA